MVESRGIDTEEQQTQDSYKRVNVKDSEHVSITASRDEKTWMIQKYIERLSKTEADSCLRMK